MAESAQHLIVVPTGGCVRNEHGHLVPNQLGMFRLIKAAELLAKEPNAWLAISGGRRESLEESEAWVHFLTFVERWPELIDRVLMIDAQSIYTAGDMAALAARIDAYEAHNSANRRFATIVMVSRHDHGRNAIWSLNAGFQVKGNRNFRLAESGEPSARPPWQQRLIDWTTKRDPHWRGLLSWPLRFVAGRDGRHV